MRSRPQVIKRRSGKEFNQEHGLLENTQLPDGKKGERADRLWDLCKLTHFIIGWDNSQKDKDGHGVLESRHVHTTGNIHVCNLISAPDMLDAYILYPLSRCLFVHKFFLTPSYTKKLTIMEASFHFQHFHTKNSEDMLTVTDHYFEFSSSIYKSLYWLPLN